MKQEQTIFLKVFFYTMALLVIMSVATIALFARQFLSFYETNEMQRLAGLFTPILDEFQNKTPEEIQTIAQAFYEKNQSFVFLIEDSTGTTLFATPDTKVDTVFSPHGLKLILHKSVNGSSYSLTGTTISPLNRNYQDLILKSCAVLGIMLCIAAIGAILFARKITRPLVKELQHERQMEENQRYFFSAASHELKTPIAAVNALIEGMIANIGEYRDHQKYLRECLKMMNTQNKLISEILELVNLSDERAAVIFETIPIADLIASLLPEYRAIAERNGKTVEADLFNTEVRADRRLLSRALSNVISNAIQNSPEKGIIRLWNEENGTLMRLNILNTGCYLDSDIRLRLFDPFFRADHVRNRNTGRSGLGLTIVKKALDRQHISFSLENAAEGVLFRLDLPIAGR
ncbi:MAG: HAMP domain-containing histidine kinase [Spirochaetaceae bacterium]|jgi:two-component system sensor histidine kinase VanS|nr:HAMP domain-containing histidine kinase [Spirochaetaceae bacterium]